MDVVVQMAHGLDAGRFATLRNGAGVRLRPIRPDDAPGLLAFCSRLSLRTVYQRFFTRITVRIDMNSAKGRSPKPVDREAHSMRMGSSR